MSQMVRYLIVVEIQNPTDYTPIEWSEPVPLSDVVDVSAFTFKPEGVWRYPRTDEGVVMLEMSGEESDWARPHMDRHAEVVRAVRAKHPKAKVETHWVITEDIEWDDVFSTDDEEGTGADENEDSS